MTTEKFTRASTQYQELKARLDAGEISVSDLKESLKRLMIVDDQGHYWMIGGKSGRWYRHDGTQWVMDDPLKFDEDPGAWASEASGHESADDSSVLAATRTDTAESADREDEYAPMIVSDDNGHNTEPVHPGDDFQIHEDRDRVSFHETDDDGGYETALGTDGSLDLDQAFQVEDTSAHDEEPSAIPMHEESELPIVTIDPTRGVEPREQEASSEPPGTINHEESWQREPTQPGPSPPPVSADTANCRVCDAVIPGDAEYCPACGANQNETTPPKSRAHREHSGTITTMQIRSIHPFSMLFLLGGLGLILGVILGASFGIFNIFGDLIYQFPRMLQETRGKIQGGLIFGVLGGLAGFISFALTALVVSGLYNILADLFGGLRIRVRH